MYVCNDTNPKIIEVEFDTGITLQKKDLWRLCLNCNSKPEFQKFRINETPLGSSKK